MGTLEAREHVAPEGRSPLQIMMDLLEDGVPTTYFRLSHAPVVCGSVALSGLYPGIAEDVQGSLLWLGQDIGTIDYKTGEITIKGDWSFEVKVIYEYYRI